MCTSVICLYSIYNLAPSHLLLLLSHHYVLIKKNSFEFLQQEKLFGAWLALEEMVALRGKLIK